MEKKKKKKRRGPEPSRFWGSQSWLANRCHTDRSVIVGRRSIPADLTRIRALLSVSCHLTSRSSFRPLRRLYPSAVKHSKARGDKATESHPSLAEIQHEKEYKIEIKDPSQTFAPPSLHLPSMAALHLQTV